MQLKTPYSELLPKLSTEEYDALKADIDLHGVRIPVCVDEDGNILDGHNRYQICPDAPVEVIAGLSEPEKRAFVYRSNNNRRNLSPDQKSALRDAQKLLAVELSKMGWTQEKIAAIIGVKRQRVSEWLIETNADSGNGFKQDNRVKMLDQDKAEAVLRAVAGETQAQIASDYGVTGQAVGKVVKKLKPLADRAPDLLDQILDHTITLKKAEHELREREKISSQPGRTIPIIQLANQKEWLEKQSPCDLLLTDPPYSTDVEDIATFAGWITPALAKVKPSGRAYVCIGAYPDELKAYLSQDYAGMELANILVWTYRNTMGPKPINTYKLNWQAILYFTGPDVRPLNCPELNEQFTVVDIAAPDGRQGDRYHGWQKPDELGRMIVRHSTNEGDVVLDPFAGTGTFLLSAAELGRIALGCDISADMIEIATRRGCANA